jgi:Ca2+-binding EF-hand superfamily protein
MSHRVKRDNDSTRITGVFPIALSTFARRFDCARASSASSFVARSPRRTFLAALSSPRTGADALATTTTASATHATITAALTARVAADASDIVAHCGRAHCGCPGGDIRRRASRSAVALMSPAYAYQDEATLLQHFNAVDVNGNGAIDGRELQRALATSGLTFSLQTIALLIRLHSAPGNKSGTLSFTEYKKVHEFLVNAQNSFTHFDKSGTKKLNKREALECLAYAGYGDVDQKAIEHACRAFDPDRSNDLGIDQFIGLFLFLAAARKVFESFDADKSGKITLDLNQFIYASAKTR